MFSGSFCAIITPFKNNKIDESAFEKLVEWQIQEGTQGLVPCGPIREPPTLSPSVNIPTGPANTNSFKILISY